MASVRAAIELSVARRGADFRARCSAARHGKKEGGSAQIRKTAVPPGGGLDACDRRERRTLASVEDVDEAIAARDVYRPTVDRRRLRSRRSASWRPA